MSALLDATTDSHLARLAAAVAARPDAAGPRVLLGEFLRGAGDHAAAEAAYQAALACDPCRVDALISLAVLLLRRLLPAAAQSLLIRACGIAPEAWEAWDTLGVALMRQGEPASASSAFFRAHTLAPGDVDIALRLMQATLASGAEEAELARLEMDARARPLDAVLPAARGWLLGRLGRHDAAADALEVATTLEPDHPRIAVAFAEALINAGRFEPAAAALQTAVALNPDDAGLRNNLGAAYNRTHRYREARTLLEAQLVRTPDAVDVLCNLANALICLGRQEEGVATARRAAAVAPAHHLPWRTLAAALAYADPVDPEAMTGAATRAALTAASGAAPWVARTQTQRGQTQSGRRLRVGLLSPTLCTHPVGWLTLAGLEALDPAAFDLVCLGQPHSGDPMQRRFRAIASEWHVVDTLSDAALIERVRGLDLDILLELGGYGDQGRLAACAARMAPVQVKWVGLQNHSTGMAAMDWFISDRWETPPELAASYTERLLLLPDGYACYSPPAHAPAVASLPAMARGHATFGCFNNLAKITPRVIATWADILRQVPDARLALKFHQFNDLATAEGLRAAFLAHGIAAWRLDLRGGSRHRDLLTQYGDIDIALDPFPYTGGLTTCEALWMGVPVITLAGTTFAGRHSTSHLSNVGLPDWVAADAAAYVAMAVTRARDLAGLAVMRAGLRGRMAASPLCDGARFGRALGEALQRAWAAR